MIAYRLGPKAASFGPLLAYLSLVDVKLSHRASDHKLIDPLSQSLQLLSETGLCTRVRLAYLLDVDALGELLNLVDKIVQARVAAD